MAENKYIIGEPFESIVEYERYPLSQMFFHGRLIGKAVTDNWQYRFLKNQIINGWLRKAKLNKGYDLYSITVLMFSEYDSKPISSNKRCVAKSKLDAEKYAIRNLKKYCKLSGEHGDYYIEDENTTIKVTVVKLSAD